jgi:hypothetical protein
VYASAPPVLEPPFDDTGTGPGPPAGAEAEGVRVGVGIVVTTAAETVVASGAAEPFSGVVIVCAPVPSTSTSYSVVGASPGRSNVPSVPVVVRTGAPAVGGRRSGGHDVDTSDRVTVRVRHGAGLGHGDDIRCCRGRERQVGLDGRARRGHDAGGLGVAGGARCREGDPDRVGPR